MPVENQPLIRFNAGVLSPLALARIDLKRYAFAAETQTNWMPRALGSMMLRPGTKCLWSTYNNAQAKHIPFVFANDDTAIIELTDSLMRVSVNDACIQRVAVTAAIANGTFTSNLTSWTDADESGAVSSWATGGYMALLGTNFQRAIRHQLVTLGGADSGKEHAVRISVTQGECTFRIGATAGGQEYLEEQTLGVGTHSLAFTPTTDFYIWVAAIQRYTTKITSIEIEGAGGMEIPTDWALANLPDIRHEQSADVIFVDCYGTRPKKIERRGTTSWSLVDYQPDDGPFRAPNITKATITPSLNYGDVYLSASQAVFKPTHVGALFRIEPNGQIVSATITGEDQYTDHILVTGVGASQRKFTVVRSGTWVATLTLEKSYDEGGTWFDVATYTTNASISFNDGLDNQDIWYRLKVKIGDYTSGTLVCSLHYPNGSIPGVALITSYTSATSVSAIMLKDAGSYEATQNWSEGLWSDYRGWPSVPVFHDGRLFHVGGDKIVGSVSDAFASFDDTIEGDSAPINRSIGTGPVDRIAWATSLQRLAIGGEGAEHFAISSSLDEPLTPSNFNIKTPSTQGSARVASVKVDGAAMFVNRSKQRVYQVAYDGATLQYACEDLTVFAPEVGDEQFVQLAIQRQPDTRLHCRRADGTVAILVYSKPEFQDINCWVEYETDGDVEDIFVLPGDAEDAVYYVVRRVINGATKRYVEKWALESECQNGNISYLADCAKLITNGSPSTTVSGLSHLEGKQVVVWADGADVGTKADYTQTYTVSGGQITLAAAATNIVVGLPYTATFKSMKNATQAALGTFLGQRQRVSRLALMMHNTHAQGLRYGSDFSNLDSLPIIENGVATDGDYVWGLYSEDSFDFNGTWDTDTRICLQAAAPRACTILGAIVTLQTRERT